jgi:hypothetical protein
VCTLQATCCTYKWTEDCVNYCAGLCGGCGG